MSFLELAKARYSCRKISDRPVEEEKIRKICEAGILSPTAANRQAYHIWVLKSPEAIEKFKETSKYYFNGQVLFVIGGDPRTGWTRRYDDKPFVDVDATIVATQMMLAIQDLGLGTTWIGSFDPAKLKESFPEMAPYELVAVFPVGYPEEGDEPNPHHFERNAYEEMVTEY